MYNDLCNQEYDYIVIGSSLAESSLSAYFSRLKKKVLQVDASKVYGGDCKNYNLKDLDAFVSSITTTGTHDSFSKTYKLINKESTVTEESFKKNFRNYNFDLNPKFIFANSKSVKELLDSNASTYVEFTAVSNLMLVHNKKLINVPFSKTEIFNSSEIDLLEKQKLLNFLYAIMKIKNKEIDVNSTVDVKKDYDLQGNKLVEVLQNNLQADAEELLNQHFNKKITNMILLILANKPQTQDVFTVDDMCNNIHKFLSSVQIYSGSPYLYPFYGSSECSQAMCRLSAVYGSLFLINEKLSAKIYYNTEALVNKDAKIFALEFTDQDEKQSFVVLTNNIVINKAYLEDPESNIQFNHDIPIKTIKSNEFCYKYIGYFIYKGPFEMIDDASNISLYKIPKDDEEFKNEYSFTVFEYLKSSVNIPRNRAMFQIVILSNKNEENEENFRNICMNISQQFANFRIKSLSTTLKNNYDKITPEIIKTLNYEIIVEGQNEANEENKTQKDDKKEEETKKEKSKEEEKGEKEKKEEKKEEEQTKNDEKKEKEEIKKEDIKNEEIKEGKDKKEINKKEKSKEKVPLVPEIIMKYEFCQKVCFSDYEYTPEQIKAESQIIFTGNDYINLDLDPYYDECEKVVKKENIVPLPQSQEQARRESISEIDSDNELIDELFNEITLEDKKEAQPEAPKESKKEEPKEENKETSKEEKKEDINKEENKKEGNN